MRVYKVYKRVCKSVQLGLQRLIIAVKLTSILGDLKLEILHKRRKNNSLILV